ncbi:MAG: lipase family protein [Hyphomicrobiales bacterium]|jgi:triacylglycerol lipase
MTILVTRPRSQYPGDALASIGEDPRGRLRAAAWLAQLAYEDDVGKVDDIAASWSLVRRLSLAPLTGGLPWQAETRLHLLEGDHLTIVSFCGTDPLRFANWVTNLRILPAESGIHSGFLAALDAAWSQVVPWLPAAGIGRRLWFVGHSLGAALAALCALWAAERLALKADRVFAFGMPRVGGEDFANRYETLLGDRTLRLVHGHDVVPHVPPSELGFRHVGRRLSCPGGGRFDLARTAAVGDDAPATPDSLVEAAGLLLSLAAGPLSATLRDDPLGLASTLLPSVIADHLPDRYCTACGP